MKHKHYEMIMAKAENMDLVLFNKSEGQSGWSLAHETCLPVFSACDYFLCLPQHKEACLHWLNGGAIESNETKSWVEVDSLELCTSHWYDGHFFMHEHEEFRVKPKKEKRWIGVHLDSNQTTPAISEEKMCSYYVLRSCTLDGSPFCEWQFIEIEVEV